jgi:hypothetical protein
VNLFLKEKNKIENEAPGEDLKPYWYRRRFLRAEEGKRESSGGER